MATGELFLTLFVFMPAIAVLVFTVIISLKSFKKIQKMDEIVKQLAQKSGIPYNED